MYLAGVGEGGAVRWWWMECCQRGKGGGGGGEATGGGRPYRVVREEASGVLEATLAVDKNVPTQLVVLCTSRAGRGQPGAGQRGSGRGSAYSESWMASQSSWERTDHSQVTGRALVHSSRSQLAPTRASARNNPRLNLNSTRLVDFGSDCAAPALLVFDPSMVSNPSNS